MAFQLIETLELILWAATIPLIPYALLRRRHDQLAALVLLFFLLLIPVMTGLNRPNPDRVLLIPVVVP